MTELKGMDPEQVEAQRIALASEVAALEAVHSTISRVRLASLNPANYAVEPGSLVLGPAAITATTVALALVDDAKANAEELIGQLIDQVMQQENASAAGGANPMLTMLGSLSASQLLKLLRDDPDLAQSFWDNPPDASSVATWWKGLRKTEQQRLITDAPTIIGNLNGVPYSDRDAANRVALADAQHDPNLTAEQKSTLTQVEQALKAPNSLPGTPQRYLLDFDLGSQPPVAAVSIGNVDTADDVTVAVPGMGTDASDSMASWTTAAQNLYTEQQNIIDPTHTHAVIAWIGYKTPDLSYSLADSHGPDSVFSNTLAQQGSGRLASELDSLHDTRVGEGASVPWVAVVGHSYGTTTSAYALTQTKYDVNAVDLVASAGIDQKAVPDVAAMHVSSINGHEQVFASQASKDDIATIGRLGSGRANPADGSFGAITYGSDGSGSYVAVDGHDAIGSGPTVPVLAAGSGHGYFDLRTESLSNMAIATTGTGTFVTAPVPHPTPQPSPTPLAASRTK